MKRFSNFSNIISKYKGFSFDVCKLKILDFFKKILLFTEKNLEIKPRSSLFILGFLNVFASPPFSFFPILFFTFYFSLKTFNNTDDAKLKFKFICYFISGHFLGQFHWLLVPLFVTFSVFFWVIPFAMIGIPLIFVLIKSIFFIPLCFFSNYIPKNVNGKFIFTLLFVFAWLGGELIRTDIIFGNGFPWMHFGHFLHYLPFLQIHHFISIKIYSLLVFLLVVSPYLFFQIKTKFAKIFSIFTIVVWIILFIFGLCSLFFMNSKMNKYFTIVGAQPNFTSSFSQDFSEHFHNIEDLLSMSAFTKFLEHDTLLMFPESAIPFKIDSKDHTSKVISSILPKNGLLMFGGMHRDKNKVYNTIEFFSPNGTRVGRYAKRILVPFGEYIPMRKFLPSWIPTVTGDMIDFSVPNDDFDDFFFIENYQF